MFYLVDLLYLNGMSDALYTWNLLAFEKSMIHTKIKLIGKELNNF